MLIYIANITKQSHDFAYRKFEENRVVHRPIPAGSQISIDTDKDEIESIITQHRRYGMVHYKDIKSGKSFNGLAYNLEKPLNVDAIKAGIEHNDQAMEEIALESRKAAAVATDNTLQEISRNGGAKVSGLEMEVEEVKRPGDNTEKFSQKVAVQDQDRPARRRRAN